MRKELEQFEMQISQLWSLKRQRKQFDERIKALTDKVKRQIIYYAGHPFTMDETSDQPEVTYSTTANLIATLKYENKKFVEQALIDQAFEEAGIFDKYAEPHIPAYAVEEATLAGDLPAHVEFFLRRSESRLTIERKCDVQSQDECDS